MDKQSRLLIVDDEPDIREILRESLADQINLIFEAGNGEEALEKLKSLSVHAILSDINMPKLNGIGLLRNLRQMGNQVPFVILSGFGDKQAAIEALKLGAFDFLEKPWKETDIVDVIGRAVELGKNMEHSESEEVLTAGLESVREGSASQSIEKLQKTISPRASESSATKTQKSDEKKLVGRKAGHK